MHNLNVFFACFVYFVNMDNNFTFCYWFGGKFVEENDGVVYVGEMGRTFNADLVDLCLKYLMNLGEMCVKSKIIEGLFYCVPGRALKEGLRKIVAEDDAFQLGQTAILNRYVDMYVLAKILVSRFSILGSPFVQTPVSLTKSDATSVGVKIVTKKLIVKRGPQGGISCKKQTKPNPDLSFHIDRIIDS